MNDLDKTKRIFKDRVEAVDYLFRPPIPTKGWTVFCNEIRGCPPCVPKIICRVKPFVEYVWHKMHHECKCPENSDKIVRCLIATNEGVYEYCEHLPGECPGLDYEGNEEI